MYVTCVTKGEARAEEDGRLFQLQRGQECEIKIRGLDQLNGRQQVRHLFVAQHCVSYDMYVK